METTEYFAGLASQCAVFRKKNFLCDTFLLVGNKQFRAHSIILAAASSFFESIYHQYQKPEAYYIRLPGVDPELMSVILDYIYTGRLYLPFKEDEQECKIPPNLIESFSQFGIDLGKNGEFIVTYKKEEEKDSMDDEVFPESYANDFSEDDGRINIFKTEVDGNTLVSLAEEGKLIPEESSFAFGTSSYVEETPPSNDSAKKVWTCDVCNKSFSKKINLDRHLQIHAEETKPNLCELCGLAITGKAEMQNHLAKVHSKETKSDWNLCTECGKTFSKESTLNCHIYKAHRKGVAGSGSSKTEGGREVFVCEYCNKQYASRTSIKLHTVMAHSETKPFQCAECGKGFAFKSQMISHTRMHTGERPFACQTCGKTFSAMLNLVQHNRIHTGERPFECSFCGNRFSQRSHLQTHVRTHTGEKPYHCHLCTKSYKNRLDLRIHCLRIHQVNIKLREPNQMNSTVRVKQVGS